MSLAGPYVPTHEQVGVAWLLANVPGLEVAFVATTLPESESWKATGFVQVSSVLPTATQIDLPYYNAVLAVDCWANAGNATRPPWGKAGTLAMAIAQRTLDPAGSYRVDVEPTGFRAAWVTEATVTGGPSRIPGDPSNFAHYSLDLLLKWSALPADE